MYKGRELKSHFFPKGFSNINKDHTIEITQTTVDTKNVSKAFSVKFNVNALNGKPPPNLDIEFPVGQRYEYYNCVLMQPKDVRDERQTLPNYPTYKFRDDFNYRPEAYIKYISNLNELDIPNFYLSVMDETNDKYYASFVLEDNLTTRETFLDVNSFIENKRFRTNQAIQRTKTILITKDAKQYKEGIDLDGDQKMDITSLRNLFPFSVTMKYELKDRDLFTNILDKYKLHQSFMHFLNETSPNNIVEVEKIDRDFDIVTQPQNIRLECRNFDSFLEKPFFKKYYNYTILPDIKNESIYTHNFRKLQANLELQNSGDMPVDLSTIINKQRTNSELLYLKVEKFIGNSDVGTPFQTIYMSGNSSVYEYFDSQVKNKQYYTYKVSGIYLLNGVEYSFKHNNDGSVTCYLERTRKIVEQHLLTKPVYVLQPLQLPPRVNVYKDTNKNKIYFHLLLNTENPRYMPFESFLERDKPFTQILNDTKQYEDPEHNYTFESARFEVFKSTTQPYSLNDLKDSFLLDTKVIRNTTDHLFIDHIEYEKDYYYLFRAVNSEGFPGNPTKLYKITLQKGVEENKLNVEIMDFVPKTEEYAIKRDFNKLLHIFPNENQNVITNLKDIPGNSYKGKLQQVEVGLDSVPSVWGKKFKFRVTSNNTGKKIDFNVKFSIKRKILEQNN